MPQSHLSTQFDATRVPSPSFVLDRQAFARNVDILADVQREAGCKVLLALKGFAMWSAFDVARGRISGTTASGSHEALLGRELMDGEVHAYAPAFTRDDMDTLLRVADHISFNTPSQWRHWRPLVEAAPRRVGCGLRVNPEYGEVKVDIYNPCGRNSRLGSVRDQVTASDFDGLEGLHFHALCGQGADVLQRVLQRVESKFGEFIPGLKWVNFGGGHHITQPDYDRELLIRLVRDFRARYGVDVYLEPGEAFGVNAGVLVATVLDLMYNGMPIAILDVSCTAHMPDVLEMPYRPQIIGGGDPGQHAHTYRLGGMTCLAGDVIGDYSFAEPLKIGDRIVLLDMAHYTMVKTTTFNGVKHPSLVIWDQPTDRYDVVRHFTYADYRNRLS